MGFTAKQRKWRRAAAANPQGFVQKRLRIADRMGRDVKFNYQWAQKVVSDWKKEQHKNLEPVRDWILKWRRAGLTAEESAESYAHIYGNDNARVAVIAHLEDRAKEILANYKMYDQSLERFHPELKLEMSKDNIFGIKFEHSNSQVLIGTAKNPIKIRGDGVHRLHGSEAAHWYNQFLLVMKEVCPVVPPVAGSQIVLESTGSDMGSPAHTHWLESAHYEVVEGQIKLIKPGKNEFKALFLRWLDDPTNAIPFANDKARDALYELIMHNEPRLMEVNKHFKLTPEQIHMSWTMYHLQSNNDFNYFCREFPYNSQMAWAAGGDSFFGVYELTKAHPEPPLAIFVFDDSVIGKVFSDLGELRRVDAIEDYDQRPNIKLWALPQKGQEYVIGADGSNGMEGGDYSYGSVLNKRTREQMASYHGLVRPDEAAHIMVSLCRMYNNALAGPETNPAGGGMEMLNCIQRLNYHNIYMFRKRDRIQGVTIMDALGWWTNGRTKPLMLGELRKVFIDCVMGRCVDPGMFRDASLLREMRTFSRNPVTGDLEANNNCFDDRVIGHSIAHQICNDETYCTKDDALFQAARNSQRIPVDQSKLITKMTPDQVIKNLMGPKSNFNRNKFEL